MESKLELGIDSEDQFMIDPAQIPVRQRNFYRHSSRPLLCQLREGIFTVNELPRYPGWTTMLQDIIDLWKRAAPVLEYTSIVRIGLRYINRFPKDSGHDPAGAWLLPTDYIPKSIANSGAGFFSRVRATIGRNDRVTVTVADSSAPKDGVGDIVLDIDRITEKSVPLEELSDQLEILHDDIWHVFKDALSARLEKHLKAEAGGGLDQ